MGNRTLWATVLMALPVMAFASVNVLLLVRSARTDMFRVISAAYALNTLVMPGVLLVAGGVGLALWRRLGLGTPFAAAAMVYLAGAFCCVTARAYATHFEPRLLKLRRAIVRTPKIQRPIRILHISDIQSAAVGSYEERAFATMRGLAPDLVVHTGDLIQPLPPATLDSEFPKLMSLFRALKPPLGVYSVYGDVDGDLHRVPQEGLDGLRMLECEPAVVNEAGARLRLFGLSCGRSRGGPSVRELVASWLATTSTDDFTILLGHAPDYVMSVQDLPIDLCLAGHTHGGQIRIPFYGPIVTLSSVPRSWARGFREVGATRLNVSAGVGSEHAAGLPAIRVNCPTEMTLIEVLPAASSSPGAP